MTGRVRLGVALIGVLAALALGAPLIGRYPPNEQPDPVALSRLAPSLSHPLGTDYYSRDVLSRVLHGARISLAVACLSVLLSVSVGTIVGLTAGLSGGITDIMLMRLVDAGLAIPRMFLLLVVAALWPGVGVGTLVVILGLASWFGVSRLVRTEVESLRHQEFITAPRALGLPTHRIALRHVLPNVLAPILVSGTLGVGNMILVEAGLSYLGFGIGAPHASLGNMMREGQEFLLQAPWIALGPGLFVVVTVLSFSVLSDGLRQTADSRSAAR